MKQFYFYNNAHILIKPRTTTFTNPLHVKSLYAGLPLFNMQSVLHVGLLK